MVTPILYDERSERRHRRGKTVRQGALAASLAALALLNSPYARNLFAARIVSYIPLAEDASLGAQVAERLSVERRAINVNQFSSRLDTIGAALAKALPEEVNEAMAFQFRVIDDNRVNAVALPGGMILINRGLLQVGGGIETAELAGVLAHAMVHAVKRHAVREIVKRELWSIVFGLFWGDLDGDGVAESVSHEVLGQLVKSERRFSDVKFSRDVELEADKAALALVQRAGFTPTGLLSFFGKLRQLKSGRGHPTTWLRDWEQAHPDIAYQEAGLKRKIDMSSRSRHIFEL